MSKQTLTQLLEEIARNPADWERNRDSIMARYELSPEEQQALRSGDGAALHGMGVEERLTKKVKFR